MLRFRFVLLQRKKKLELGESDVQKQRTYPSLYLKCLKAKVMTSLTMLSRTG